MEWEWIHELMQAVAGGGPWAAFAMLLLGTIIWVLNKHFHLNGQTIEVMTAIRTLIENLECRGGNDGCDDDSPRHRRSRARANKEEV